MDVGFFEANTLFAPEQLTEVYRGIHKTLKSEYPITNERQKCLEPPQDSGMKFWV